MSASPSLLYLTDAEIAGLDLTVRSVRHAIDKAFLAYGQRSVHSEPKTSVFVGPGHGFQSLMAVDTHSGFAALKWVGMVPPGGAAAVNINANILLSDAATGQLRCLMDGRRATALRTAGMTAVAAQYLARKDSSTIGFVGAGVQAEGHLIALADLLPSLRTVYVNSRTPLTAQRLASRARELGFEAVVVGAPEAVSQSDVVVTTVPLGPNFQPFIDASWVRPGAFVAAVDLARSWKHEGLRDMEITVVDEEEMKHYAKAGNFIPALDYAEATLADLVGKRHAGRVDDRQRAMLFTSGSAVADLAIAMLIFERARDKGVGTILAI